MSARRFRPLFPKVIAHHVTYAYPDDKMPPAIASAHIVGYSSNEKIECFVVSIDGSIDRPSGGIFHLTYSLDPEQKATPKQSNDLLHEGWELLEAPFKIELYPKLIKFKKRNNPSP